MEDNELIQDSEEFDKEEKDKVLSTAVGYRGKKLKSFWQIQAKWTILVAVKVLKIIFFLNSAIHVLLLEQEILFRFCSMILMLCIFTEAF